MTLNMKTREELAEELRVKCELEKERDLSNKLYARKLVEDIVFALIGLISVAFIASVIRIIWK